MENSRSGEEESDRRLPGVDESGDVAEREVGLEFVVADLHTEVALDADADLDRRQRVDVQFTKGCLGTDPVRGASCSLARMSTNCS